MTTDALGVESRPARLRRVGTMGRAIGAGLAVAVLALLWITILLLTGPGATGAVFLVVLLFILPILSFGALAGWLAGLTIGAVRRRTTTAERR